MARVTLNKVTKRFGDVIAVNEFTLDIQDKEFLVLVGPSGCGKSTTLRMVAGLEEISSGEIFIGDTLVNEVAPKDRDIAMVFQNYALYPHMNAYDNMAFGLKLRGFPRADIDKRVREAAGILGIEHLLNRKPKELSGGQRQRVALGRAIVREPKVFLMDEPLSNLDAKLRVQMRTEIAKLHHRLQTTVIYVTHDQTEAMTMGTRIVVMKDGLIQQAATPQEVYDHPTNMFVAGFIGSPAMNFLQCQLVHENGDVVCKGKGFSLKLPPGKAQPVRDWVGREVVLGVRPEDFDMNAALVEKHPGRAVQALVEVVEPLGSEMFLYLSIEGQNFTARVDPGSLVRYGDRVTLYANMDKCHLFDIQTERTLV